MAGATNADSKIEKEPHMKLNPRRWRTLTAIAGLAALLANAGCEIDANDAEPGASRTETDRTEEADRATAAPDECMSACKEAGGSADGCKQRCIKGSRDDLPSRRDLCWKGCAAAGHDKSICEERCNGDKESGSGCGDKKDWDDKKSWDGKKGCKKGWGDKKDPPEKDDKGTDEQWGCFKKCVAANKDEGACKKYCFDGDKKDWGDKKDPPKKDLPKKDPGDKGPSVQDFCYKGCISAGYETAYCKPKCYGDEQADEAADCYKQCTEAGYKAEQCKPKCYGK